MNNLLCVLLVSTFITVNGTVQEVPADSPEYAQYQENVVTDIGNPGNLETTLSITDEETETVSSGDSATAVDNEQIVSLLAEQVELLAENSTTVTGTINTSVLDLMDRMIDDYPSYYKYAGFRVDSEDSYRTTLYIAKRATVANGNITFSDDCVAVNFYRYTQTGYSSYIYYDITDAPNATVNVNSNSIVYTNALDGYPSLGDKTKTPDEYIWIGIFALFALVFFLRRSKND